MITTKSKFVFVFVCLPLLIILLGGCDMKELATIQITEADYLYSNPTDIDYIGDPYVIKASDGFYYMFCTSASNGYFCWKSADLYNWTDKKMAYTRSKDSWAFNTFWAPEVVELDGVYYMYYTAKRLNGSLRIGVATSSSPDGPYEEALDEPLFDFGYAAIDAHVFIDDDNKKYLYYSRDCSENIQSGVHISEIYGIRLNDDMISVEGDPVLLTSPTQMWEIGGDYIWNEGPEVIKHNGIYYLTYSSNFYASRDYSVGYATSASPLGEYTKYENNPILSAGSYKDISGPGHHSFTLSPDEEELFMVYHTHTYPSAPSGDRQVNIDRVVFTDTGEMYVNGPTISSQPLPFNENISNIASSARITYHNDAIDKLNDGIFTIHRKNKEYDYVWDVTNEAIEIKLSFDREQTISSILLYRGVTEGAEISHYNVAIDGKYIINDCYFIEDQEQRAAIATFEPIKAKELVFKLYTKEGSDKLALSEIMILEYRE